MEDPTKVSSRQEKHVKKYVKEYFDKAVAKKREHEKKKAGRRSKEEESAVSPTPVMAAEVKKEEEEESDGDQDMAMSDDDEYEKPKQESETPVTPLDQLLQAEGLKRKRVKDEDPVDMKLEDDEATPSKRLKSESPPPPPPPPPADGTPPDSVFFSNGGIDDIHQHSYEAYRSLGDTESMGMLPESNTNAPPPHPPSNDTVREVQDVDISGNAHTPDTPSEHRGIFGGNGRRHLSDIEVHGAA